MESISSSRTNETIKSIKRKLCEGHSSFEALQYLSRNPVLPAPRSSPINLFHTRNMMCNIFSFDLMPVIALGMSKMLKTCLAEMLKDENRAENALQSSKTTHITLGSVTNPVLRQASYTFVDVYSI